MESIGYLFCALVPGAGFPKHSLSFTIYRVLGSVYRPIDDGANNGL